MSKFSALIPGENGRYIGTDLLPAKGRIVITVHRSYRKAGGEYIKQIGALELTPARAKLLREQLEYYENLNARLNEQEGE